MENSKIETIINGLINTIEDKEQLEALGSLKSEIQALNKEQETVRHQLSLLEEDNKFYKDAYRESIKFGGFKQEASAKPDVEQVPQDVSFEGMLAQFMSEKGDRK